MMVAGGATLRADGSLASAGVAQRPGSDRGGQRTTAATVMEAAFRTGDGVVVAPSVLVVKPLGSPSDLVKTYARGMEMIQG
jgi:hypothetical protein